jgi:hypothetical protein
LRGYSHNDGELAPSPNALVRFLADFFYVSRVACGLLKMVLVILKVNFKIRIRK